MAKLWRHRAGRPGHNLVVAYERAPGGPKWVEWWPHGKRKRQSLRHLTGKRVYDEDVAAGIADAMAAKLEAAVRKEQIQIVLGVPEKHSLDELLKEYHKGRQKKWEGSSNRRHQEAMREFWLDRLGKNTDVRALAGMAGEIERIASDEADAREWSPRTEGRYLKYLVTAVNYGRKKLKWYGEGHDLSAIEVPQPDSQAESYSTEEVRAILGALEKVDLRAAVAGWLSYTLLRRITAIRSLPVAAWRTTAIELGEESVRVGVLQFDRRMDKARKRGEVAVAGRALQLLEVLLQKPAVRASGLLFPSGDLEDKTPNREPVRYETLHDWLHDAEPLAEIEHIKGRAWHAFKRRAATDADEEMGSLSAASKQAGTTEATLRAVYLQRDLRPKAELAVRLARRAAGGTVGGTKRV